MDALINDFLSYNVGKPEEIFLRRLECAKRLVLEGDAETHSREDIRRSIFRLTLHSSWLASEKLIHIHQELEMAMVYFFWEFAELFDLTTVLDSFARSIALLQGTFMELYLEPDHPFANLMEKSGNGIFSLPEILMNAPPLVNRFGEQDNRIKGFRNQRWEIPMVYILCGVSSDILKTVPISECFDRIRESLNTLKFTVTSSRDAGLCLFLLDSFLLRNDNGNSLAEATLEFVKEKLEFNRFVDAAFSCILRIASHKFLS